MTPTFGVITKRGSAVFTGTEEQIEADVRWWHSFIYEAKDKSLGVVSASAPKREEKDGEA